MQKYWLALVILTGLFHSHAEGRSPVPCAALLGSCDYYRCLENGLQCGKNGYLIGFAHKYCERSMRTLKQKMESSKSEQWIYKTSYCLQKKVNDESLTVSRPLVSCEQLQKDAYNSHSTCYVQSGFCDLSFKEKLSVLNSIKEEALSLKAWGQLFEIIEKCAQGKPNTVSS